MRGEFGRLECSPGGMLGRLGSAAGHWRNNTELSFKCRSTRDEEEGSGVDTHIGEVSGGCSGVTRM